MTIAESVEEERVITLKDLEQDLIERVSRQVLRKDQNSSRQSREPHYPQGQKLNSKRGIRF